MKFLIRSLQVTDIAQIHEIETQSFTAPWTRRMFYSELESRGYNHSLVAVDVKTGEVIGYCCFWIIEQDEAHINNIAVHPHHRRKGVAKDLMKEATLAAMQHGVKSVTLEVRESNAAARSFYEKLGFLEVGRRKGYYTSPKEDALILRRDI